MNDFFQIPATAIAAFEAWSNLRVFVWDLDKVHLLPYLPPVHLHEKYPHCFALHGTPLREKCIIFERQLVFEEIGKYPEGIVKRCHAGLLEWVVPIMLNGRVVIILYAGQRLASDNDQVHIQDWQPASKELPWGDNLPTIQPVAAKVSQLYMEGLRQLAARIQLWLLEAQSIIGHTSIHTGPDTHITRRNFILNYIYQHHTEPITLADLAAQLHLSESRMAHVVKETCAQSFHALLIEARLRSATTLLRHSELPVADIAEQCGFNDLSRFYKRFKQKMGLTPIAYRRQRWYIDRV